MNNLVRRMASMGIQKLPGAHAMGSRQVATRSGAPAAPSLGPSTAATAHVWSPESVLRNRFFSSEVESTEGIDAPGTSKIFTDESGQQYGMLYDTRNLPKLKPGLVNKRLAKCKTYIGREHTIRQSPWKLNRVCQLAAGLTLEEALTQLRFCDIKNADLVAKVLKRTSNLADIRDGIQISQLEVAECFVTKAMMLRRMKPMGRGRAGVMHHKFSNIRVVLREIDFPLRIYQQKSLNQKKKWLIHQQRAERDAEQARAKREEMERLERKQEEQLQERKAAANN